MNPPPEPVAPTATATTPGAPFVRSPTGASSGPSRIERFTRAERVAHWVNATLFFVAIGTGLMFQFGIGQSLITDRALARAVHVIAGFGVLGAFALNLLGRRGEALRRDVRRLSRWSGDDIRWLRSRGRHPKVRLGKFNSGQKLNATFVAAAAVVLAGTGSIMYWNRSFATDLRTGADFVHGWFAYGILASVAGHIVLALRDRESLSAITNGYVSADWARHHRPRWYEEHLPLTAGDDQP